MAKQSAVLRMVSTRISLKTVRRLTGVPTETERTGQRTYSGVLAQPMSIHMAHLLENGPPHWYPNDAASWAEEIEPIISRDGQAIEERLSALARWHGIELDQEPDPGDCLHRLAFALAEAHVPGFAIGDRLGAKLPGKGAPAVLGISQTILLAACVHDALNAFVHKDGRIATLALTKFDFKVPRRKSRQPGSVPLTQRTATHLVKEMRSAWRDVLDGSASAFQFQVVSLALVSEADGVGPDWSVIFGLPKTNIDRF